MICGFGLIASGLLVISLSFDVAVFGFGVLLRFACGVLSVCV